MFKGFELQKMHVEKILRMKKKTIKRGLKLDIEKNQLINSETGERKQMEPRLTNILALLLNAKGQVVRRDYLIEKVWGNYNSGEQLLTHSMAMLRKEIGSGIIKTIPKKGYLIEDRNFKGSFFEFKSYYWFILLAIWSIARIFLFPHH